MVVAVDELTPPRLLLPCCCPRDLRLLLQDNRFWRPRLLHHFGSTVERSVLESVPGPLNHR